MQSKANPGHTDQSDRTHTHKQTHLNKVRNKVR